MVTHSLFRATWKDGQSLGEVEPAGQTFPAGHGAGEATHATTHTPMMAGGGGHPSFHVPRGVQT